MGQKRLKKPFRIFRAAAIAGLAAVAYSVPANAEISISSQKNLDVYELNMTDIDPVSSLEARFLESKSEDGLELINIDPSKTTFEADGLDPSKTGLQTVSIKMTVVTSDDTNKKTLSSDYNEDVLVKMVASDAPQLVLSTGYAIVDYESEFNANSYIAKVSDSSGDMPVLKINSTVDTSVPGDYLVTYTAVNSLGISTEAAMTVHVNDQTEEQAAAEAAALAAAQAQAQQDSDVIDLSPLNNSSNGLNPYPGYNWNNCTWGAWEAAYDFLGVQLPNWGDAYMWLYTAASSGWSTGYIPVAGSIAVYSNHVAYVVKVSADGQSVFIVEGNYLGHQNMRWVPAYSGLPEGQALQGYVYLV